MPRQIKENQTMLLPILLFGPNRTLRFTLSPGGRENWLKYTVFYFFVIFGLSRRGSIYDENLSKNADAMSSYMW